MVVQTTLPTTYISDSNIAVGGSRWPDKMSAQQHARPSGSRQSPAVMSLQKEVNTAQDTSLPADVRVASLSKLHAVMAAHQANRPGLALALLPWFLAGWPQLVACLWDPNPQLPAAVAPLLGIVGGLVASSRGAAVAAATAQPPVAPADDESAATVAPAAPSASCTATEQQQQEPAAPQTPSTLPAAATTAMPGPGGIPGGPPVPPAGLLFDWLLPLLTGKVGIPPAGSPAPLQLQVLICKTLIYALQQLPSFGPVIGAGAAAATAADTYARSQDNTAMVPAHAGGCRSSTAASVPGDGNRKAVPGLLTAPVPKVAAEQLRQHLTAVLSAVQELLEAVTTPLALLAPLLQLLLEVIRLDSSAVTSGVLRDLLDLLLGWSLEPGLQPRDRQLISRVLSACKSCWLAEPQLVADVGSKLLNDLQQQLPPLPQGAKSDAPAAVQAALPPAADRPAEASAEEQQQQHNTESASQQVLEEQQHKFLALLTCLVAILTATSSLSSCQQLVVDTAALMIKVHEQYSAMGASHHSSCSAAAQVAVLMLALWQPVAAAVFDSTAIAAGVDVGASAASRPDASSDAESGGGVDGSNARSQSKDTKSRPGFDIMGMFSTIWKAVLRTLQLQLLLSEDALGLLEAMSNTMVELGKSLDNLHQHAVQQTADTAPLHSHASTRIRLQQLATDLPAQVFAATLTLRHTQSPDVQAAAGCLYTSALLLDAKQPGSHYTASRADNSILRSLMADLEAVSNVLVQQTTADAGHSSSSDNTGDDWGDGDQQLDAGEVKTAAKPAGQHQQHQQQQQQASLSGLTHPQLMSVMLFDLVTLEAWLSSHDGQQQHTDLQSCSSAAAVAAVAAAASGSVAQVIHGCIEVLKQAGVEPGLLAEESIAEQLLAVLAAVVAVSPARDNMRSSSSSNLGLQLLQCLRLFMQTSGIEPGIQCNAVELVGNLLLCQLQQQLSHVNDAGDTEGAACMMDVWQQALPLVAAAAAGASAALRGVAVETASKLAFALWRPVPAQHGQLGQDVKHHCQQTVYAALVRWLSVLLDVLVSRCSDLDAHVASAATTHVNNLALPIYLMRVCTASLASPKSDHSSSKADAISSVWLRTVALQQQQRGFKPAQLAQLFEQLMQASLLLLQRRPGGSAAAPASLPQQQQFRQWHAHSGALYRLAQTLPVLPPSVVSSSVGKPGASTVDKSAAISFEDLTSGAVTSWMLVQEAARHCVSARLRTHLGNPTQTFNMLEKLLQSMLHRLHTDGSPAAAQRAWQQLVQQRLQSSVPQQQQQQQQAAPGDQHPEGQQMQGEPQQLLQAAAGPAPARYSTPHPHHRSKLLPHQVQQQQEVGDGQQRTPETFQAAEQQRAESEAAALSMLDFMLALEVNVQAAAEGSLLRPAVSKSVMAFFAGNKKVCEDWLSRTRETLLNLSVAAGAQQHAIYHGMLRLQELQATLRSLTKQYQAQQQQLLLQQQQQYVKQQGEARERAATGSNKPAAVAAAAAAAAITGLGIGVQQADAKGRRAKQQRGRQQKAEQQQQQDHPAAGTGPTEHAKLKTKQGQAAADGQTGSGSSGNLPAAIQEQRKALVQSYQTAMLRLAAPVLSALVLLSEALIHSREHSTIAGLQAWSHRAFNSVWTAISRFYALDLGADDNGSLNDEYQYTDLALESDTAAAAGSAAQQQQQSTMLLLNWLPGAAAEAAGRYEEALQLHKAFLDSHACAVPLGACLRSFVLEHMAACYAAVGDWQGLAGLDDTDMKAKDPQAQQQQQQQHRFGSQYWALAGAAGLVALHQWQLGPQQQQQQQQQQHQGRHRPGGAQHTGAAYDEVQLLDAGACCNLPGMSPAWQAILNAVGALQLSSMDRGSSTGVEQSGQQEKHGRHHKHGTGSAATQGQQKQLPMVLSDLQAQIQQLSSTPLRVLPAGGGSSTHHWLQLSLLQLLQDAVAAKSDPQHVQQGAALLGGLLEAFALQGRHAGSNALCWDKGLDLAGGLRHSCFADVQSAMPLVQVLGACHAQCSAAFNLLTRETLLACNTSSCSNAQQRLLDLAGAGCSHEDGHELDASWLHLLASKLRVQNCSSSSVQTAAMSHVKVLSEQGALHVPGIGDSLDSRSVGNSSCAGGDRSGVAAAYLSLADLVDAAYCQTDITGVDWQQLYKDSLQQLIATDRQGAACANESAVFAFTEAAAADAIPPQRLPAAACCAAAIAATPAAAEPWKAYGDMLHALAAQAHEQQLAQQEHLLLAAAAAAYCNHLAVAVNAKALDTPEQGLKVLLRLLTMILQHGDALQLPLQQALSNCPVSVWQVLTPQLLGQLQHSSAAVRALVQQLLQGLAVVVPCAVLYPLVVEVRAAEEAGQEPPAELAAVLAQLQFHQPRLLADTVVMAAALEGLTVTPREAWVGLLMELGLEVNRKLLALQADAARLVQQGLDKERRIALITTRYHTVMSPVLAVLRQHLTAAAASPPGSPDEAAFREQMLPQLQQLLNGLQQPPAELLRAVDEPHQEEQQQQLEFEKASSASRSSKASAATATAGGKPGGTTAAAYAPLKQLQQQLSQQLRQQQRLQLAQVAPLLADLRNTAIPLPADDLTASTLPPLQLHAVLDSNAGSQQSASEGMASLQQPISGAAVAAGTSGPAAAGADAGSWLCIAGFDHTVLVLPTKTRPKRLRLLANDGSMHAFLLKGRDDLRVDERLMQFMRAANALLTAPAAPRASAYTVGSSSSSCSEIATAGITPGRIHRELRIRPYSITPFGRRAGLVQWVRHTTSLFGLVRAWQSATAERLHAVAAAKRDAAAAAAVSSTEQPTPAAGASNAEGAAIAAADGGSSSGVVLPLMVAASRPADAFYARLLPALQAAGVPVGASRSQWPAAVLRSTFTSLQRDAPKLLLARQLVSSAATPAAWWTSQQCFATSAAVGSMLGWVLGLGDRHLDNLLLDTESGELLHIDFSVCFDKGAGLGVPEVVPFRLTQIMQSALGPGGLAGTFGAAAAAVLSTLRSSSDMLSALLALLLADPAVDWSVEREAHAARKDQDTSVSLKLFASRMEELRQPLLAGLAAALPTVGNGLAAVVSYGEAHLYMQQLQTAAAAARSRAEAAKAALAEATDGEVRALTDGAAAGQKATTMMADYRRLCGLAGSCLSSAANWLTRHQETLQTLTQQVMVAAGGLVGSHNAVAVGAQLQGLLAHPGEWSAAACDRALMLLGSNTDAGHVQAQESHTADGILQRSLGPVLSGESGFSGSSSSNLLTVLPADLLQQCQQVDSDGRLLLQQQSRLMQLGRWAVGAYAAALQQLLPGHYIHHSHHWAWSHAFTAAVAGPNSNALATAAASAPLLPSPAAAAESWACLAACWVACQLQQQQHAAAVSAAAATLQAGHDLAESAAADLSTPLRQLAASMGTASEADSARVQLVASQALAVVCETVHAQASLLHEAVKQTRQSPGLPLELKLDESCDVVQQHLAALQGVLSAYQQSGLSYILDLSSSMPADDLPEAATSLEDLLEQHTDGDDQLQQALQQQQQSPQHQHWVAESAGSLQLLQQLMSAIKFEALPPLASWAGVALPASEDSSQGSTGVGSDAERWHAVMMQAGPVSQVQLWSAAAALVHSTWQQLQQRAQQALQLTQQMKALAAVAGAGGSMGIPSYETELLALAEQLHAQLLPQGYDITVADDCMAAAQLLQLQWSELERAFMLDLAACLCPLLGLSHIGLEQWLNPQAMLAGGSAAAWVDDQALSLLQQLVAAAAAGVSAGTMMHSKDIFDTLAGPTGGALEAGGSGSSSSSDGLWGTPDLSAAWKSLVILLLQCGCLQQHIQQQQPDVAIAEGSATSSVDALNSGVLPLDFEQHRPLVFVIQVLHSLLQPAGDLATACANQQSPCAAAAKGLYDQMQQLLVPAVSNTLLPSVTQHLSRLQCHLQLLVTEATAVMLRPAHGLSATQDAVQHSSTARRQHDDITTSSATEGAGSQGMGLGGLEASLECGELVPFDAFDQSLPGADMTLEEQELGGLKQSQDDLGASAQGSELVPFDAFDASLPGAGMMLEGGIEGALEAVEGAEADEKTAKAELWRHGDEAETAQPLEGDSWWLEEQQSQQSAGDAAVEQQQQQPKPLQLPELVPFSDFDPALPGAGAQLEAVGSRDPEAGQLYGSVELSPPPLTATAAGSHDDEAPASAAASCAAEWQMLGQQLLTCGLQQARQLASQQELAALQQAGASVEWQLQVWLRHVAAFEWLWGDLLELALHLEAEQQLQLHGGSAAALKQLLAQLVETAAVSLGVPSTGSSSGGGNGSGQGEPSTVSATATAIAAAAAAALRPGDAYQWYFTQLGLLPLLPLHPDQDGTSSTAAPLSSLLNAPQQGSTAVQSGGVLRMPSRSQLLHAWQEVSEALPGLESGLTAWHDAVTAAAAAVRDFVSELAAAGQQLPGDPAVCFKVLCGLCNRSQHWCSAASGLSSGVSQLGEAALQLEYSRRGRLWAPGMPDGVDAFQGNAALLMQLHNAAAVLTGAEAEVAAAKALLSSCQAAAQQAELTLDEAAQEEATAEYELALKTPAALARAQALTGFLMPMVNAAADALTLVTEGTGNTLRALVTLVERNSAARDLAPITNETVAQHGRCVAVLKRLHTIGSAAAAGLQEALLLHQQQAEQQPEQQGLEQQQQQQLLLQLLLVHMQPALQGVKEDLHELGQAHILLTQLTHQLDSLAAAAQTVAAAITADHALQMSATAGTSSAAAKAAGASVRQARAEARRRAFAAAALERCTARLTGQPANSSAAMTAAVDVAQGLKAEVASLVAEATSMDRLSRMFEGWAAWM